MFCRDGLSEVETGWKEENRNVNAYNKCKNVASIITGKMWIELSKYTKIK